MKATIKNRQSTSLNESLKLDPELEQELARIAKEYGNRSFLEKVKARFGIYWKPPNSQVQLDLYRGWKKFIWAESPSIIQILTAQSLFSVFSGSPYVAAASAVFTCYVLSKFLDSKEMEFWLHHAKLHRSEEVDEEGVLNYFRSPGLLSAWKRELVFTLSVVTFLFVALVFLKGNIVS